MATTACSTAKLQFAPFSSALDAGFWHKLSENKLDVYGLDDKPRKIHGFYFNGDAVGIPCRLNVDYTAFNEIPQIPPNYFLSHGILQNKNTIDAFKSCDKKELLSDIAHELWSDITSGKAIDDPTLLSKFLMLTYADLKKYHYYYWFTFPALCAPETFPLTKKPVRFNERFTEEQTNAFLAAYTQFQESTRGQRGVKTGYFILQETQTGLQVANLKDADRLISDPQGKVLFCVCDPSTLAEHPGWPVRNLLTLIAYHWADKLPEVEIVSFRDRISQGSRDISHSLVFTVQLQSISNLTECPKCVGWEKNAKGKLVPRMVDLSATMDPVKLSESSVDLNLKLMRWRLLPELNLEKITRTRCLLLGAGTLGCNVARSLLGWGVRKITFVDNSRISYSNPVRQSLFVFEDCLHGGKAKAEAAAESLRRIFPGVDAQGHSLTIPMPGHPLSESSIEQTRKDVAVLEELVDQHDVIFLLMDTRESRWLPTLLGAAKGKIVLNAALGFDTFLVVRHGVKMPGEPMDTAPPGEAKLSSNVHGSQLGCYFCNDVVAPGDSTRDRTLDQQCTVSRPGMSMITAALAVELLVSILQHPEEGGAPADTSARDEHITKDMMSILGLVPHQIRGFLSRYYNLLPASRAFEKCTACSSIVIEHYRKEGFGFLLSAFNQPSYLEDLTGLTQLHQETLDSEVWAISDDDESM